MRFETVTNSPEEFRVRNRVLRVGKQRAEWVQLRSGVKNLFRYLADTVPLSRRSREVSLPAKARCLEALTAVDDPTPGKQVLLRLTAAKKDAAVRSRPGFNPMAQLDADLFKNPMDGVHCLRGNNGGRHRRTIGRTRVFTTG